MQGIIGIFVLAAFIWLLITIGAASSRSVDKINKKAAKIGKRATRSARHKLRELLEDEKEDHQHTEQRG